MIRTALYGVFFWMLLVFSVVLASPQAPASIPRLPGTLSWQNAPASWHFENDSKVLTISAGAKTD